MGVGKSGSAATKKAKTTPPHGTPWAGVRACSHKRPPTWRMSDFWQERKKWLVRALRTLTRGQHQIREMSVVSACGLRLKEPILLVRKQMQTVPGKGWSVL